MRLQIIDIQLVAEAHLTYDYFPFTLLIRYMVRYSLLLIFVFLHTVGAFAQISSYNIKHTGDKHPISLDVLGTWPSLDRPSISTKGNYVCYTVTDKNIGSNSLIVSDTTGSWTKEIVDASDEFFSVDNRLFIFRQADSLFFLTLGTNELEKLVGIKNMRTPKRANGTWLAYQKKENPSVLFLRNLITGKEQEFYDVSTYSFDEKGVSLLLQNSSSNDLKYVDLEAGRVIAIWSGMGSIVKNIRFDTSGRQLAFIANTEGAGNSIWYYTNGMASAKRLVDDQSYGIDSDLLISSNALYFNANGRYISFGLQPKSDDRKRKVDAASVDIWHYNDKVLQSVQVNQPDNIKSLFIAVTSLKGEEVIRLEKTGERVEGNSPNEYVIVVKEHNSFLWQGTQASYYLVSMKDGTRKLIIDGDIENYGISPRGNYVVLFDKKNSTYLSYSIKDGVVRNITENFPERLTNEYALFVPGRQYPVPIGIAGWLENDSSLLIYDNYDIWQVDPEGRNLPVNVTNRIGRNEHIKFQIINENDAIFNGIKSKSPVLLTAFNPVNKYNGFYHLYPGEKNKVEKLFIGPYRFIIGNNQIPTDNHDAGMRPICAENANVWLVKRESSTEAPNYFLTTNFKSFKPLTNIQPQMGYNWLTTELITYKQMDGSFSQGVLYKPENFDPSKRYPIIFYYYESLSHYMYKYLKPELAYAVIDIPWFVSNGYMVFTPDIHYSIASSSGRVVGDDAVNSILSAATYLGKRRYIDTTRMGLQGHSFGGGETLYIITQSKKFAAACSANPTVSNQISAYLSIHSPKGKALHEFRLFHSEIQHDHIGATLWQRPDLYIKASPVFKANKVSTPLLLMHNQNDLSTNWEQAIEMYMALRRLGKRVWMLQYDEEGHSLLKRNNKLDFTIRLIQFFDHYLKGTTAPRWMTKGIPATLKGIDFGYDLDSSGACGIGCKYCKKTNNGKVIVNK